MCKTLVCEGVHMQTAINMVTMEFSTKNYLKDYKLSKQKLLYLRKDEE